MNVLNSDISRNKMLEITVAKISEAYKDFSQLFKGKTEKIEHNQFQIDF